MVYKGLILFLCFFKSVFVLAQPEFNFDQIKNKYPEEDAYILHDKTSMNIEMTGGKPVISTSNETVTLLLNDKAPSYAEHSIYYSDFREDLTDVKAASYIPGESKKLKRINVEKITKQRPVMNGIFYDDFEELSFMYPGLVKGAVTSVSYNRIFKEPRLLSPFFFVTNYPVKEAEFSITFPKEVRIKYILAGKTEGIQFTKEEGKKSVKMTWRVTNQDGFKSIDSYNVKKVFSHIIIFIDEYESDGKRVKVLSDNSELYRWYFSQVSHLFTDPDNLVKTLADSITRGIDKKDEQVKKIYYWVQESIKYIAFEDGLGGFVPRSASLVCSRRYGDCKDKSSLLYAMLKAKGINSCFTWLGTRELPYSYSEVSTPIVANHMIISLHSDSGWIFLDGTSHRLPLGYPSYSIQGKEAMISISPDSFVVVKVPVVDKEKSQRVDSVFFSIDGNTLKGNGITCFTGFWKNRIENYFFDVAKDEGEDNIKSMLELGSNKCKVELTGFQGEDSYNDSLFCFYKFNIPDYISSVGKKLYVNMNLEKDLQTDIVDTAKMPYDKNYLFKSVHKRIYSMSIPEFYKVNLIPSDTTFSGPGFDFTMHYQKIDNKVFLEKTIRIDEILYSKSTFKSWNNMVSALNEAYSMVVVLEKMN